MTIELNHMIVPAYDNEASARFYADLFEFEYAGPVGHFAPVRISQQALTLDFDTHQKFFVQHYAFKVSEAEFDRIFGRMLELGMDYGSGPRTSADGQINHANGGRGVYFRDPNGHLLELLTRDSVVEQVTDAC